MAAGSRGALQSKPKELYSVYLFFTIWATRGEKLNENFRTLILWPPDVKNW